MPTYLSINKIKYPDTPGDRGFTDLVIKLSEIRETLSYVDNLPVIPSYAHEIRKEEKIRAIRGTTGIEGNALDEDQISLALESANKVSLPEMEAINSGEVHDFIIDWSMRNPEDKITEPLIKQIHKLNTDGISYIHNEPGKYRNFEVTYGYPPKKSPLITETDIKKEMEKLDLWINDKSSIIFPVSPSIVKGVLAHYALSRIHPFSDGNGRTARALEALIFYHMAKINDYCFYGISNYCYRHRDEYIRHLSNTDISGDATDFLLFCINGFHESIEYVKNRITTIISELMYMDFIHFLRRSKEITKRAVEIIDTLVKLKSISYTDYYKIHFAMLSGETKRRYLKRFSELDIIKITEKDGKKDLIIPNFDVLKTIRRMVY